MSKHIKDLKDLSILRGRAGYRHSGPTDLKRIRDVFSLARTMARDRPSPYGDREAFFFRSAGDRQPRWPLSRDVFRSVRSLIKNTQTSQSILRT